MLYAPTVFGNEAHEVCFGLATCRYMRYNLNQKHITYLES